MLNHRNQNEIISYCHKYAPHLVASFAALRDSTRYGIHIYIAQRSTPQQRKTKTVKRNYSNKMPFCIEILHCVALCASRATFCSLVWFVTNFKTWFLAAPAILPLSVVHFIWYIHIISICHFYFFKKGYGIIVNLCQIGKYSGFVRPSSDGTYYAMVISVRVSARPTLYLGLRLSIFCTFFLHALTYWVENLHMTLF